VQFIYALSSFWNIDVVLGVALTTEKCVLYR